jgi:hypothetical protein
MGRASRGKRDRARAIHELKQAIKDEMTIGSVAEEPKSLWFEHVILRLGVPISAIFFGISLMAAGIFTWGVIWLTIGLLVLIGDIFYKYARFWSRRNQVQLVASYFLIVSFICWFWIFTPAPLELSAGSNYAKYGNGSTIHGIKWEPEYSYVEISISNPSNSDYEKFDASITTDMEIAAMNKDAGLNVCQIGPANRPKQDVIAQEHDKYGNPVGTASDTIHGRHYFFSLVTPDGQEFLANGTDKTYRVVCDKLLARSSMTLFAATVSFNSKTNQYDLGRYAKNLSVKANYEKSGRGREQSARDLTLPAQVILGSSNHHFL